MWNGQFTPYELARKASAAAYHWLALEYDDYGNSSRWLAFRDECVRFGILAGIWTTVGGGIAQAPASTGFVIAEVEGPGDYDSLIASLPAVPNVPRAIVTNFSTLTPERCAPLIAAGYECLTECYLGDNPLATPERMDGEAKRLGWARSQPVFGCWNKPLSEYAEWAGDHHAVYLAENIL